MTKTTLELIVAGLALCGAFEAQPFRLVMVDGQSMSPSYESGQFLVANRSARDFRRGDVVVFDRKGQTLIKRVAFLPGDRILQFHFLGSWIAPPSDFVLSRLKGRGFLSRVVTVPEGELFVLGDNALGSIDSRVFGPIPMSSVEGKVLGPAHPGWVGGFAGTAEVNPGSPTVYRKLPLSPALLEEVTPSYRPGSI